VELPTSLLCLKQYSEFHPTQLSGFELLIQALHAIEYHNFYCSSESCGRVTRFHYGTRVSHELHTVYIYHTLHARCTPESSCDATFKPGDDRVDPECRKCGRYAGTDKHVALVCVHGGAVERRWGAWEDMDERRWLRKTEDLGEEYVVDLVEMFFANLDMR